MYDLSLIDFPVAALGGEKDILDTPKDVEWTVKQLGKNVIFSQQYPLGHFSFIIGSDMSFFEVDVMAIMNVYNNKTKEVCQPQFDKTLFKMRHMLCKDFDANFNEST